MMPSDQPPAYSPSPAQQQHNQQLTEDLQRRQEELERKAAELARKEQEMKSMGYNSKSFLFVRPCVCFGLLIAAIMSEEKDLYEILGLNCGRLIKTAFLVKPVIFQKLHQILLGFLICIPCRFA